MPSLLQFCDCIILGGGLAGSAMAIALANRGIASVAVLHRPPPPNRYRIGESAAPTVGPLLARLGLDANLQKQGHTPCHANRALWGSGAVSEQDFFLRGMGHGWHLDRLAFDEWLKDEAEVRGAAFLNGAVLVALGYAQKEQRWGLRLQLPDGARQDLFARTLVDATGSASLLARRLGAKRKRIDTLTALVALVAPAPDTDLHHISLIEACDIGWWYAAAIPDGRLVLTLMTDVDLIRAHGLRDTAVFLRKIAETELVQRHLASMEDPPEILAYPAGSSYLDKVAGPGWLAIGNAAIAMDPLTASGINCALGDALWGCDAIVRFLAGDIAGLQDYAGRLDGALRRYLNERQDYYSAEPRWRELPFWARRRR